MTEEAIVNTGQKKVKTDNSSSSENEPFGIGENDLNKKKITDYFKCAQTNSKIIPEEEFDKRLEFSNTVIPNEDKSNQGAPCEN